MQDKVYNSEEVKHKLADLLLSLKRFNDANNRTTYDKLIECRKFLNDITIDYVDDIEKEIIKMTKHEKEIDSKNE